MTKYLVRQYRPAYFSGFDDAANAGVEYDDITKQAWMENFKHDGFKNFTVEPYAGDELIISANYDDGKHWVAAFALPEDSKEMAPDGGLLRDNWRYRPQKST